MESNSKELNGVIEKMKKMDQELTCIIFHSKELVNLTNFMSRELQAFVLKPSDELISITEALTVPGEHL